MIYCHDNFKLDEEPYGFVIVPVGKSFEVYHMNYGIGSEVSKEQFIIDHSYLPNKERFIIWVAYEIIKRHDAKDKIICKRVKKD